MAENGNGSARLLVVSQDFEVLRPLSAMMKSNFWQIDTASDAQTAIDKVESGIALNLLVLDLPKAQGEGLQILQSLRRIRPTLPVVLIGHPDDVERKQESIRMGVCDYVVRPFEDHQLEAVILENLSEMVDKAETDIASDGVEPLGNGHFFIGSTPAMQSLRANIALLADVDVPVYIFGESGSGRQTTARLLHKLSIRSGFEFARINCAALPEELLEREIFGQLAVGATASPIVKRGKLERFDKGTIFLDEITEMPLRLQANLAQVLQDRRFIRRGTSKCIAVDVRIVAAGSISIDQAVSSRRLLADLARHLRANELQVPPLRERREEIPFLLRHFLHGLAKRYGSPKGDFTPAVIEACQEYEWPGNLRELEQFVKRYLIVGDEVLKFGKSLREAKDETRDDGLIAMPNVHEAISLHRQQLNRIWGHKSLRSLLQSVKEETERNAIAVALQETGWNRKAAARLLKTSYRSVLYKIEQYHLNLPDSSFFQNSNGLTSRNIGPHRDDHADQFAASLPRKAAGRSHKR